jgi:hypothetical protein
MTIELVSQKMELVEELILAGKIGSQDQLNAVLASLGKILTLLILEQGYQKELRPLFQKYLTLCNLRLESTGSGSANWIW